ncbi:MAG: deoxyhypusine synthase family protein [Planctomycetota bacterium]|nr:deoxyhypusine synthase family protein [Planctomycetota bacterium]
MAPTRHDERSGCPAGSGRHEELPTLPVDEASDLDHIFDRSLPAFGGAHLRKVWQLLDEAIGRGVPMTISIAGPVTLSGQVYTWLNPLLDTGWFMLVSTTDAVCYHDGHRALDGASKNPIYHVGLDVDDGALRDERTVRVTDLGFNEELLLEQDRFLRAILRQPEFQRRMSGTELRFQLGHRYAAQERKNDVREGLMALCWRKAIPVFVGAPGDGSVFLNSLDLWCLREAFGDEYCFDLDVHLEVYESCAYHRWGTKETEAGAIGTLILGGGVPKNFNLQPEPTLGQILGFENVPGFLYDIQITTAPVSDGSLSSCPPSEAVTWGKVDKEAYRSTCVSLLADYSTVMPFLVRALLAKRARFARLAEKLGPQKIDELYRRHPEARGYLRPTEGYRLMERREELMGKLLDEIRGRETVMRTGLTYDLAPLEILEQPTPTTTR